MRKLASITRLAAFAAALAMLPFAAANPTQLWSGTDGTYWKTPPGNDDVDRERFVREWFDGLKQERPAIKIVVWENHNNRVISRSPEALELYRKLVQDPYWIAETWRGEESN